MKSRTFLFIGLVFLLSCEQEDKNVVNPNLLTGLWRLEQVTFNQIDGTEINDWISNSTILNIDDNNSYYRNYIGGEWSLSDRILVLDPVENLSDYYWKYEVLGLTKDNLIVRIKLTEGQYCCDFNQFTEAEILTITEKYVRSE